MYTPHARSPKPTPPHWGPQMHAEISGQLPGASLWKQCAGGWWVDRKMGSQVTCKRTSESPRMPKEGEAVVMYHGKFTIAALVPRTVGHAALCKQHPLGIYTMTSRAGQIEICQSYLTSLPPLDTTSAYLHT